MMSRKFWIALKPSNPKLGLSTILPPLFKKLDAFKLDQVAKSGNTASSSRLWNETLALNNHTVHLTVHEKMDSAFAKNDLESRFNEEISQNLTWLCYQLAVFAENPNRGVLALGD